MKSLNVMLQPFFIFCLEATMVALKPRHVEIMYTSLMILDTLSRLRPEVAIRAFMPSNADVMLALHVFRE